MSILMELKGVNGQVELYADKLVIKRKGALSKMTQGFFKGDKTLYLRQITGIQVKPGSALSNGYIQFTIPGGNENLKGIMGATKDENTVMFAKKENDTVVKLKAKIEELQASQSSPMANVAIDAVGEIKKYKELMDDGVISPEEFNAKKKQLMGL